jgi:thiosulfate dehydrogenase [quinone] large subunit
MALIVAGTVATGVFAVIGVNHLLHTQQSPAQMANVPSSASGSNPTTAGTNTPHQGNTSTTQPTDGAQSTPTSEPSPTQGEEPQATAAPPQPTVAVPSHTGTVIGSTTQAFDSATSFMNPADGQASLLVRLANGYFVAGRSGCTHAGTTVNYNPSTQKLDCPAHGAIFDPANGFSYVPGSFGHPLRSLGTVTIRVNGDGTITTG